MVVQPLGERAYAAEPGGHAGRRAEAVVLAAAEALSRDPLPGQVDGPLQGGAFPLRNQPQAQLYFDRPLTYYLNLGFQNGFVLDGFEERAFSPEQPQSNPLAWGGNFSEIPPVVVMRMRLVA